MSEVRVEGHTSQVLLQLKELRDQEKLCDVILLADNGTTRIPAHRNVLAANSEYFNAMFNGQLREATEKEVSLKQIDGTILQQLIDFCYTGHVAVEEKTVTALCEAAAYLQLASVLDGLTKHICNLLNPSNCLEYLAFGDELNNTSIQNYAESYICRHFLEVSDNAMFLELSADRISSFLGSNNINVLFEQDVFHCLMKWVMHDRAKREELIGTLLILVRLPQTKPEFVLESIEPFCKTIDTKNLIVSSMKWYHLPKLRPSLPPEWSTLRNNLERLFVVSQEDGMTAKILEYFFPIEKWITRAELCDDRYQFAVTSMVDSLYFVGGCYNDDDLLYEALRYNIPTGIWSQISALIPERRNFSLINLKNKLYAVDGDSGDCNLTIVWEPAADEWIEKKEGTFRKYGAGVVTLNDRIYIAGGMGDDGVAQTISVECYNPSTDQWCPCAAMNHARSDHGIVADNGHIYVVGGDSHDTIERYDPVADKWSEISVAGSSAVTACVRFQNRILAFGEELVLESGGDKSAWTQSMHVKPIGARVCGAFCIRKDAMPDMRNYFRNSPLLGKDVSKSDLSFVQ